MALSSEHREEFNAQVNSFRSDRMKWPKDWQVDHSAYIAAADHLTAVEGLLREIGEVSEQYTDDDGYQAALSDPQILLDWQFRIAALLGPAATEGGQE